MIHYFASSEHCYTMQWYVDEWAPLDLVRRVAVHSYAEAESLPARPGVYVFSDLERLSEAELGTAVQLWERLRKLGAQARLLNDPARALRRRDLLRGLHEQGVNPFNAFHLSELCLPTDPADSPPAAVTQLRFPVFLREASDHNGTMTTLLHSWREIHKAAHDLVSGSRWTWDDLLAVEFCDTCDEGGLYMLYGAFVIGDRIVGRNLTFAREWQQKGPQLFDERHLSAGRTYVSENPHADVLAPIAALARIDYGRIDYAMVDGRPRIWEINTNPTIMPPSFRWKVFDRDMDLIALRNVTSAMRELAGAG